MDEERTEQASPRKRQRARQRGEGPRSKELTDACNLLAGTLALWMSLGYAASQTAHLFSDTLLHLGPAEWSHADAGRLFTYILGRSVLLALPVMGAVLVITALVNAAQSGFVLSTAKLEPKLDRLNPIAGFQRLASTRGTVETLKNLLKMAVAGLIVYTFLKGRMDEVAAGVLLPPQALVTHYGRMAYDLGLRLVLFLLLLAVLDYFYQRYEFEKSLRMTKQEVREELKQTEGDPLIRRRIRERARQIATTRMLAEVPQADVVITNPTHFAVALRYTADLGAPTVVAKGQGPIALRIRELATVHGIAIEENPPLAQTLFKTVEVGHQIPVELYEVLAEILAKVYAAKGRRVA
ncbi:MAG TPA: flagellar biosynthesis protein FlhB [bacterium]|nr:flagellar biosynthesis protein FlhB [bacterium]